MERGYKETFDAFHKYCKYNHQVCDENHNWFFSCFLIEKQKQYDREQCECCMDICPIMATVE